MNRICILPIAQSMDEAQRAQLKIMWNKIDQGAGAETWEVMNNILQYGLSFSYSLNLDIIQASL